MVVFVLACWLGGLLITVLAGVLPGGAADDIPSLTSRLAGQLSLAPLLLAALDAERLEPGRSWGVIGRCGGGEPQHHPDTEVHAEAHAEMVAVCAAVLLSSSTFVPLMYWLASIGTALMCGRLPPHPDPRSEPSSSPSGWAQVILS